MFTPAMTASSTSSPRAIRSNAVSTQVFAPPFVYRWPLSDAIATGLLLDFTLTSENAYAPAEPPVSSCRNVLLSETSGIGETRDPRLQRHLPMLEGLRWLAAGWRDFWTHPASSIAYGIGVFLLSVAFVWTLVEFGRDYIDAAGALDRARMRTLAFADASARRRLEAILHPLIGAETTRRAAATNGHVVFDVPLLVESGRWRSRVDKVLVVDCSASVQAERVATRPGWTREAALAVIAQQAPRALRRASADAVIHNDGISRPELEHAVQRLWAHWCG